MKNLPFANSDKVKADLANINIVVKNLQISNDKFKTVKPHICLGLWILPIFFWKSLTFKSKKNLINHKCLWPNFITSFPPLCSVQTPPPVTFELEISRRHHKPLIFESIIKGMLWPKAVDIKFCLFVTEEILYSITAGSRPRS